MLDHWQIGDEVTLAGPLGEFVYLPVRDGKTVIVFPSARIASICGSNSLILVYFLDIAKPPRVVLLSYTGRLFVRTPPSQVLNIPVLVSVLSGG